MRSMYLDDLQIHNSSSAQDIWVQGPIEGLSSPDYRLTSYDKPGEDGGQVSTAFYGMRPITLSGIIKGSDPTNFENNRRAFSDATSIERDTYGFPIPKRLTLVTNDGREYFLNVHVSSRPVFNHDRINYSRFMLQLLSDSPYIFGATKVISSAVTRAFGGGFILPVILPIVASPGSGGILLIDNPGNAAVKPVFTITGPVLNPYIGLDGKYMQLDYDLPSGSTITIDMAAQTIILDGSSNLITARVVGSSWLALAPGSNSISFSTGLTADTGTLQTEFYPAYLGI